MGKSSKPVKALAVIALFVASCIYPLYRYEGWWLMLDGNYYPMADNILLQIVVILAFNLVCPYVLGQKRSLAQTLQMLPLCFSTRILVDSLVGLFPGNSNPLAFFLLFVLGQMLYISVLCTIQMVGFSGRVFYRPGLSLFKPAFTAAAIVAVLAIGAGLAGRYTSLADGLTTNDLDRLFITLENLHILLTAAANRVAQYCLMAIQPLIFLLLLLLTKPRSESDRKKGATKAFQILYLLSGIIIVAFAVYVAIMASSSPIRGQVKVGRTVEPFFDLNFSFHPFKFMLPLVAIGCISVPAFQQAHKLWQRNK